MKFLNNIAKDGVDVGAGIAGGGLGRALTNKFGDKIPMIGSQPKLKPAGAFILGLLAMGNTKGMMREGGRGMAIVAGTDILGNYVPMVKAEGVADDINGLGEELADTLYNRLNDDVNSGSAAVNDDINDEMNDDINDDVNNGRAAVNGEED